MAAGSLLLPLQMPPQRANRGRHRSEHCDQHGRGLRRANRTLGGLRQQQTCLSLLARRRQPSRSSLMSRCRPSLRPARRGRRQRSGAMRPATARSSSSRGCVTGGWRRPPQRQPAGRSPGSGGELGAAAGRRLADAARNRPAAAALLQLPYSTSEAEILEFFSNYSVTEIAFVYEPDGRPSGLVRAGGGGLTRWCLAVSAQAALCCPRPLRPMRRALIRAWPAPRHTLRPGQPPEHLRICAAAPRRRLPSLPRGRRRCRCGDGWIGGMQRAAAWPGRGDSSSSRPPPAAATASAAASPNWRGH